METFPGNWGFSNPFTLEGLGLAITIISFFYVLFTLTANVTDDTETTILSQTLNKTTTNDDGRT